jgi:AraC-like DNA-binding protein
MKSTGDILVPKYITSTSRIFKMLETQANPIEKLPLLTNRPLKSLFFYLETHQPELVTEWLQSIPHLTLEVLMNPETRISYADAITLWQRATELTQDPLIGLHVGLNFDLRNIDAIGKACMSCSTLGEGYEVTSRYYAFMEAIVHLSIEMREEDFTVEYHLPKSVPMVRPLAEYLAGAFLSGGSMAAGKPIHMKSIHFPFPEPEDSATLQDTFKCEMVFDSDALQMTYPIDVYHTPMSRPDPGMLKLMEAEMQRLLRYAPVNDPFLGQIQSLIATQIAHPQFGLDWVANLMGQSGRTFERLIAEKGTSFREIVNQVRESIAKVQLQDPMTSISDIAFQLGYSDLSSFTRAFKGWTGLSPSAYLKKHLTAVSD